jgi:hypothetical protein
VTTRPPQATRRGARALIVGLVLAALGVVGTAQESRGNDLLSLCPGLRPLVDAGRSDVLGPRAEFGIRCGGTPLNLQMGLRYTGLGQGAMPFAVLSLVYPLSSSLALSVTGSLRERWGDYEINRLPEVTLQWSPASSGFIRPTFTLSAGLIDALQQNTEAFRAGGTAAFAVTPVRIAGIDFGATVQFGDYAYGTGQGFTYWTGVVSASTQVSPSLQLGVAYIHQEGTGVSPLAYDFVGPDQYLAGQFSLALTPAITISLGGTFNVPGLPTPMRDLTLSLSRPSQGWSVGVTWHQPSGQAVLIATLPQ